jgi:hypothetical protein
MIGEDRNPRVVNWRKSGVRGILGRCWLGLATASSTGCNRFEVLSRSQMCQFLRNCCVVSDVSFAEYGTSLDQPFKKLSILNDAIRCQTRYCHQYAPDIIDIESSMSKAQSDHKRPV